MTDQLITFPLFKYLVVTLHVLRQILNGPVLIEAQLLDLHAPPFAGTGLKLGVNLVMPDLIKAVILTAQDLRQDGSVTGQFLMNVALSVEMEGSFLPRYVTMGLKVIILLIK